MDYYTLKLKFFFFRPIILGKFLHGLYSSKLILCQSEGLYLLLPTGLTVFLSFHISTAKYGTKLGTSPLSFILYSPILWHMPNVKLGYSTCVTAISLWGTPSFIIQILEMARQCQPLLSRSTASHSC